jgi:alanine-glyoxylate transaminase / serine-glyoxylate transaminase / serine-pyruvate transaminase
MRRRCPGSGGHGLRRHLQYDQSDRAHLPGKLAGKEKELVAGCRARGFGIWPTLSEPIQVRIGILNQLTPEAITEIAGRFADAMLAMGSEFDKQQVMNGLKSYYAKAA